MWWILLTVVNLPLYLFLGWLVFDTAEDAAETFFETIVAILKAIFIPGIVRLAMDDWDDEEGWGLLPIFAFLFACIGITYGEHYVLSEVLGWWP